MARPTWSGVLSLGLVTLPVNLYTATEDHTIRFRQLQRGTSDRVRNRRVNERTGKEVTGEDIVKGYELEDGDYVVVEPEELDQIAPGKSQVIDVSGFVELDAVAPVFVSRSYYLGPKGREYEKVYQLLREGLAESGKAGIATMVMRNREYLVAVRAADEVLVMHTLHWADEVRDPSREVASLPGRVEIRRQERETARQLIDAMTIPWQPEDYRDTYEEKVRALVEAKSRGEKVTAEAGPPAATNVVDLMTALEQSVSHARSRRGEATEPTRSAKRSASRSTGNRPRQEKTPARSGGSGGRRGATSTKRSTQKLAELSRDELYQRATKAGVPGRSKMNRQQLLDALSAGSRT